MFAFILKEFIFDTIYIMRKYIDNWFQIVWDTWRGVSQRMFELLKIKKNWNFNICIELSD